MAWDRKAPYDANGNLQHYPEYSRQGYWDSEAQVWMGPEGTVEPEWRDVAPFHAVMTLEDGVTSGRSAKYTHWRDQDGRRFPMFVAELVELVVTGVVKEGGVAEGGWTVCKRGSNFGLRYVRGEGK
jgi:hypothetical protein